MQHSIDKNPICCKTLWKGAINKYRNCVSIYSASFPEESPNAVNVAMGNKVTWTPLCMQRKSLYCRKHSPFTPSASTSHNQSLTEEHPLSDSAVACYPHVPSPSQLPFHMLSTCSSPSCPNPPASFQLPSNCPGCSCAFLQGFLVTISLNRYIKYKTISHKWKHLKEFSVFKYGT